MTGKFLNQIRTVSIKEGIYFIEGIKANEKKRNLNKIVILF